MASTPNVYAVCDNNCHWETMTKEQIITAIEQALETGKVGDVDAGFITKIKETNASGTLQFWIGTTAEYNAIATKDAATLYILTDDSTADDFNALAEKVNGLISGSVTAAYAAEAAHAANAAKVNDIEITRDSNGVLKIGDTIIPQKKVLWEGELTQSISNNEGATVSIYVPITAEQFKNKVIEIEFIPRGQGRSFKKVMLTDDTSISGYSTRTSLLFYDGDGVKVSAHGNSSSDTLEVTFRNVVDIVASSSGTVAVYSVSEIIE